VACVYVQTRFVTKYRHVDGKLELKVTDDRVVRTQTPALTTPTARSRPTCMAGRRSRTSLVGYGWSECSCLRRMTYIHAAFSLVEAKRWRAGVERVRVF